MAKVDCRLERTENTSALCAIGLLYLHKPPLTTHSDRHQTTLLWPLQRTHLVVVTTTCLRSATCLFKDLPLRP